MFEKKERLGLIVYLHYNRDVRKLHAFGEVVYHSRRMRYVLVYVDQVGHEEIMGTLKKERFVKKVLPSYMKDLDQNFVGNLYRKENENEFL